MFLLVREWQCICNVFNIWLWALYPESEGSWQASLELLLDSLPGKKQRFFHAYFTDQVWMTSKLTKNYEKYKPREINSIPPAVTANFLHVKHLISNTESALWHLKTLMCLTHHYCLVTLVNAAKVRPWWTLLTPPIQILYFKLIPTDANWNHLLWQAQDNPLKYILSNLNSGITARKWRLFASILTFKAEDEANLLEITLCWVLHKYSHYSPYHKS